MATAGERSRRASAAPRVEGSGEVLALIRTGRARTIGELAVAMDMARSTVAQRVELLQAAGLVLVAAVGAAELPGRGRPPTVLRFNARSGVVLVAHVGMTGARVAVTDLDGATLAERFAAFAVSDGVDAVAGHLREALVGVLEASDRDRSEIRGVGVGLPSAVELATARGSGIAAADPWDAPVTEALRAAFGVPVFVDNDVNMLALGEQRSCWRDTEVLLCLKVGTVLGCGTVIGGEVVAGAQGVAGDIGHMSVPGDRTPCGCGNVGCLDAVASGRVLAARLRGAGLAVGDARDVARLAREGVPEAVRAVRAAGRSIGEVLAYAVNLLNPGVVAVWGYLAEAEAPLFAGLRESVYQRSQPAATRTLQLVRARMGDGAGLAGTAMMVVSRILGPDALDAQLTAAGLAVSPPP